MLATARSREPWSDVATVRAEFPTFVDLVCLAVTAGESLRGRSSWWRTAGGGPLGEELRRAAGAHGAAPLVAALEARAPPLGVAPLDRFVDAVGVAQERGMPLADSLRAMAFDVRETEKRERHRGRREEADLDAHAGRRFILPVAIVFAFYPGLVAIRTLAR